MRIFISKHPILIAMTAAAAGFAAGIALVGYYLSSWMVLPLI